MTRDCIYKWLLSATTNNSLHQRTTLCIDTRALHQRTTLCINTRALQWQLTLSTMTNNTWMAICRCIFKCALCSSYSSVLVQQWQNNSLLQQRTLHNHRHTPWWQRYPSRLICNSKEFWCWTLCKHILFLSTRRENTMTTKFFECLTGLMGVIQRLYSRTSVWRSLLCCKY